MRTVGNPSPHSPSNAFQFRRRSSRRLFRLPAAHTHVLYKVRASSADRYARAQTDTGFDETVVPHNTNVTLQFGGVFCSCN